jgi:hypothetical protein
MYVHFITESDNMSAIHESKMYVQNTFTTSERYSTIQCTRYRNTQLEICRTQCITEGIVQICTRTLTHKRGLHIQVHRYIHSCVNIIARIIRACICTYVCMLYSQEWGLGLHVNVLCRLYIGSVVVWTR